MAMIEVEWSNLTAPELKELAARDAIVIVPVGSTEQHGPHLPVQVDSRIAGEVARRAARSLGDRIPVVVAPTVWCGLAEHHMSFGGTFTVDLATFHGLLRCVCHSLVRHGFRRIALVNGHGGNVSALDTLVGELTRELGQPIVACTYFMLAQPAFARILERQPGVMHACEGETSMLLALCPELVKTERLAEAFGEVAPELLDEAATGVHRWWPMAAMTDNGVIGDARAASAEKGERLLAAATAALVDRLAAGKLWTTATDRGAPAQR